MKLLIVGATGFVGSSLVRHLRWKHQVYGTVHNNMSAKYCAQGWTIMQASDLHAVENVFKWCNPDVVINAAGYKDVRGCEQSHMVAYKSNVEVPAVLAAACRNHNKRLVHISTDMVFDGYAAPYTELADTSPMNVYGHTKMAAENVVGICKDTIIIRTGGLYDHGLPLFEAAHKTLGAGQKMSGFTNARNTPTYLGNLAASISHMLLYEAGLYHISDTTTASRYDLLREFASVHGYDPDLIEPADAPDSLMLPPDVSLKSVFTNPKATSLREGLLKLKDTPCESH